MFKLSAPGASAAQPNDEGHQHSPEAKAVTILDQTFEAPPLAGGERKRAGQVVEGEEGSILWISDACRGHDPAPVVVRTGH